MGAMARQTDRRESRIRIFRPPQVAEFEGFVVWCYTQGLFLGQVLDQRTRTTTNCYVRNGAWAVQFDNFDEAVERANELHTPTLILFSLERHGAVYITGTEQ
jgi:hypothetical protein